MQIQTIGAARTMSTREIAELTGKLVKHVNRDAEQMIDDLRASGEDGPDLDHVQIDRDARGYIVAIHLPQGLSITLVTGYSVVHRHRVVKRWQELEAGAQKPVELSRMDILRLALESEEARLKAEAERDEAIRTKALIGSKREATAMATASAAKRETAKLREELGACARHATITAVQNATGAEYSFMPLRRWCKENGAAPVDVPDKRYGKVKAWPAAAWAICYDVDLSALFGVEVPA